MHTAADRRHVVALTSEGHSLWYAQQLALVEHDAQIDVQQLSAAKVKESQPEGVRECAHTVEQQLVNVRTQ
jgi:hypothetical protein